MAARRQVPSSYYPGTIAFDSADNFYFSDQFNNRIRKVDAGTGVITTLAGTGPAGFSGDGGAATSAELGGLSASAWTVQATSTSRTTATTASARWISASRR